MSLSSTIDTADWKVPVEPTDVTLQLKGETRKDARIFRQIATASNRPQSVLELLNFPSHFLPAKMGERFLMLQKKDIRWVEGGKELLPPDDGIDPLEEHIRVEMRCGYQIDGTTMIVAPPGQQRVLDLLNGPAPFFVLNVKGKPRIVNKRYVHCIELIRD